MRRLLLCLLCASCAVVVTVEEQPPVEVAACGPVDDCGACASDASEAQCADEVAAVEAGPGGFDACYSGGGEATALACEELHPEAGRLWRELTACICGACSVSCCARCRTRWGE